MRAARVGMVLVVFAALFALAAPAASARAGSATISGVVTGTDGQPIEGVTVRDNDNYAAPTVTDVDGAYALELVIEEDPDGIVQPIDIYVEFTKAGYVFQCYPSSSPACDGERIRIEDGDEILGADATLLRAATISGSLTDANGDPVLGSIRATDQDNPRSQLDWSDTGTYTIPGIPPGRYIVHGYAPWLPALASEVWQDGYDDSVATIVEVEEGEDVTGIDFTFEVGARISGRVTDHKGDPVPFTNVQAERSDSHLVGDTSSDWYRNSSTDADGYFDIPGISPGEYVVRANLFGPNEVFHPSAGSFDAATKITVDLGDAVTGIDIKEPAPGTSEVRVFNAIGLAGGSGGTVAICPAGTQLVDAGSVTCSGGPLLDQATIDAGGYASFFAVPAGSYQIGVIVGGDVFTDDFATTLATNDVFDCYVNVDLAEIFCAVSPDDPPPVTDDDDGVPAAVEDGAPNGGDGNGDGIADSQQAEVTSLPAAIGTGYVTIVGPDGSTLQAVTVTAPPGSPPLPPGASLDAGVISYTLDDVPVGGTVDIDVHLSGGTTANGYLKLQGGAWVELPPSAFDIAGNVVTLHLVDGGVGDQDGAVNGVIVDPGAPARLDKTPPVITCPTPPKPLFKANGATLTATVTDAGGSGLVSPTKIVPLVTTTAGVRSVTVAASDKAGNVATKACAYQVVYKVQWVIPISGPSRHSATNGEVVPLTFRLVDAQGKGVTGAVVSAPTSTATTCPAGSFPKIVSVKGTAVTGTVGGGLWLAGWKADKAWKGTCRLVKISLADGTAPTLVIKVV